MLAGALGGVVEMLGVAGLSPEFRGLPASALLLAAAKLAEEC
jgi:hypothetical protein